MPANGVITSSSQDLAMAEAASLDAAIHDAAGHAYKEL